MFAPALAALADARAAREAPPDKTAGASDAEISPTVFQPADASSQF